MSIEKDLVTEDYTPDVGEKGLIYLELSMISNATMECTDESIVYEDQTQEVKSKKYYTYEKTDSTSILLSLQSDDTALAVLTASLAGGIDGGTADEAVLENNSGVIEASDVPEEGGGSEGPGAIGDGSAHNGHTGLADWTLTYAAKRMLIWPHWGTQNRGNRGIGRGIQKGISS